MGALIRITETSRKLKISRLTAIPLSEIGDLQKIEVKPFEGLICSVADILRCDAKLRGLVNFVDFEPPFGF